MNDQCSHHIETSQLICSANQLTGFYMMRTLVVKGLNLMKRLVEIFAGNNHQNKNDHMIFILKRNNAVKAL